MEKENKTIKAIVVILVVGIGLFHNIDKKSFLYEQLNTASTSLNNDSEKSDSLQVNENNQVNENKLFIYTKKIIDSGIEHLISNI